MLSLSKVVDTFKENLIRKLSRYGIRGLPLGLLSLYLSSNYNNNAILEVRQATSYVRGLFAIGHFAVGQFAVRKNVIFGQVRLWLVRLGLVRFFFYCELFYGNPTSQSQFQSLPANCGATMEAGKFFGNICKLFF